MSGVYLDGVMAPSLLDVARRAIPSASGWSGWERRARSSGGFPSAPMGVVVHHTASPYRSTPGQQFSGDASYCAVGHEDAPVGNMVLGPDGECSVHAAGAANTQGKGGPWTTSRGVVPLDGGNSRLIAIEASNDGQGQVWSPAQCEAYSALVSELAGAYGFRLDRWDGHGADILSHEEWTRPSCPGRKCDPAGPSPWSPQQSGGCSAGNLWAMDLFRDSLAGGTLPGPTPTPPGDDEMPRINNALLQATGADGTLPGAVFLTDGLLMSYRWVRNESELLTVQHNLRVAGISDQIVPNDDFAPFGVLVGPEPH